VIYTLVQPRLHNFSLAGCCEQDGLFLMGTGPGVGDNKSRFNLRSACFANFWNGPLLPSFKKGRARFRGAQRSETLKVLHQTTGYLRGKFCVLGPLPEICKSVHKTSQLCLIFVFKSIQEGKIEIM